MGATAPHGEPADGDIITVDDAELVGRLETDHGDDRIVIWVARFVGFQARQSAVPKPCGYVFVIEVSTDVQLVPFALGFEMGRQCHVRFATSEFQTVGRETESSMETRPHWQPCITTIEE